MTQKSRAEINVRRLLTRCESLAEEDHKDWKLEKVPMQTTKYILTCTFCYDLQQN